MRKKLYVGLLILGLSLTACGSQKVAEVEEEPVFMEAESGNATKEQSVSEEKDIDENGTVEPVGDSSIEAQLQLFIDKSDKWYDEELVSFVGIRFTFSDLDQNGRIEMILAENANSGHYTSSYIYEVNENFNDINEIKYRIDGEEDAFLEPDIIEEFTRVYEKYGEIIYLYDDYVRSGFPYHACIRQLLCKRGDYIDIEKLATLEANYDQLSEEEYGYVIQIVDVDENTIDLDNYRRADALYFGETAPHLATFSWDTLVSEEDAEFGITIDTISPEIMEKLYQGFGFTEGELPEDHYYDPEQLEDPYTVLP